LHYTESSYGLYKSAHHILALIERTWYTAWSGGYEAPSLRLRQRVVP